MGLTSTERAAIDAYLASGGNVTKVPTGASGLYDEYGMPRKLRKIKISPHTQMRLDRAKALKKQGLQHKTVAKLLGMSPSSLQSILNRWG